MKLLNNFNRLNGSIQVAIGIALVAMLALLVVALAQWWRTPANRFNSLPKWVWFLVIIVSQPFGPIIFLLFGRTPVQATEPVTITEKDADIVTLLYGEDTER